MVLYLIALLIGLLFVWLGASCLCCRFDAFWFGRLVVFCWFSRCLGLVCCFCLNLVLGFGCCGLLVFVATVGLVLCLELNFVGFGGFEFAGLGGGGCLQEWFACLLGGSCL